MNDVLRVVVTLHCSTDITKMDCAEISANSAVITGKLLVFIISTFFGFTVHVDKTYVAVSLTCRRNCAPAGVRLLQQREPVMLLCIPGFIACVTANITLL